MASPELYAVLCLPRSCFEADINKAFRAFSLRWHPKRNTADPAADERFRKVCEAYEVLSNWRLRSTYDRYGSQGLEWESWRPAAAPTTFRKFWETHGGADDVNRFLATSSTGGAAKPPEWDQLIAGLEQRQQFSSGLGGDSAVDFNPWSESNPTTRRPPSATATATASATSPSPGYTPDKGEAPSRALSSPEGSFVGNREAMLAKWRANSSNATTASAGPSLQELSQTFKQSVGISGKAAFFASSAGTGTGSGSGAPTTPYGSRATPPSASPYSCEPLSLGGTWGGTTRGTTAAGSPLPGGAGAPATTAGRPPSARGVTRTELASVGVKLEGASVREHMLNSWKKKSAETDTTSWDRPYAGRTRGYVDEDDESPSPYATPSPNYSNYRSAGAAPSSYRGTEDID